VNKAEVEFAFGANGAGSLGTELKGQTKWRDLVQAAFHWRRELVE